jgi:hypothetical protein
MMGGMGADAGAPEPDADSDDNVVCTVVANGDGTYTVYAGDEPEGGGGDDGGGMGGADMSEDDADAMPGSDQAAGGGNGAAEAAEPAPQGQQAGSIGAALKLVMDALREHESSGAGSDSDQFAAGYSADQSPTPASGPQKY